MHLYGIESHASLLWKTDQLQPNASYPFLDECQKFQLLCIVKCKVLVLPKRLILNFLFDGLIQTILVAVSMKISEACTGALTCANDAFVSLKTMERTNNTCVTCTIVSGLAELFYFFKPVYC